VKSGGDTTSFPLTLLAAAFGRRNTRQPEGTVRVGLSSIAATNFRPAAASGPGPWSPTAPLVDVGECRRGDQAQQIPSSSAANLPFRNLSPLPRGGAWSLGGCSVYRGTPGYWTCNCCPTGAQRVVVRNTADCGRVLLRGQVCGWSWRARQVVYCAPSLEGEHGAPKRRLTVRYPGEAAMEQHAPRDHPQSQIATHHPLE
jgi:hypothetical protein